MSKALDIHDYFKEDDRKKFIADVQRNIALLIGKNEEKEKGF